MRVKEMMTKNPVTVSPDTLVLDARRIMKEKNIHRLPVLEKGKLIGIVTKHDLLDAAPSPAAPVSVHDLNYLLSKMKVKEIMKKNPVTVTPNTPFEDALRIGQEKKIGSFPVVENGKLVGITTESDIIRFLIHALGIHEEGSRITIVGLGEKLGELEKIISITNKNKTMILSMIVLPQRKKGDWMIELRLKTKNPKKIIQNFKKDGFDVTWAVAPVKEEW
ncbi:MAG: CBS and ACT domain-containing protein [Thermodesulfobacteriota bacterium]|jgi:acetoin utilization protein AcuB